MKRGNRMQESIQWYMDQYRQIEREFNDKILNIIKKEIYEVDSNIIVEDYLDIGRIYIKYNNFKFQFTYYYFNNTLNLRGYGKTNNYAYVVSRYSEEEQKIREKSYTYVRNIVKQCLERVM